MDAPSLACYLPQDRARVLSRRLEMPDRVQGSALFADITGFTSLTEALTESLGQRRGVEELTRQINAVYAVLIAEVERYGGSVISFAGDSITCWFDTRPPGAHWLEPAPSGLRAVACAAAMQAGIRPFSDLGFKVVITGGPARRFAVGDPQIQLLDALAGETIIRLSHGDPLAHKGEVLIDRATYDQLAGLLPALLAGAEWRTAAAGTAFAAMPAFAVLPALPGLEMPLQAPALVEYERLRPWILQAVFEREQSGHGAFLTELRPGVPLFVRFTGIDYDHDEAAAAKLDLLVSKVQRIMQRYGGTLLDLSIGDKGSYLYCVFGAPVAHEDDAYRATQAALELRHIPSEVDFLQPLQIGVSRGVMRAGAYGCATRQTYGVIGDEANLAARLMQAAEPGQILVSGRVYNITAAFFDWRALPQMTVKGKKQPLPVYQLLQPNAWRQSELAAPRYKLQMVGRQAELARIEARLELARQSQFQLVAIAAEAGMGKSRLLAEAIQLAGRKQISGYAGECQSYGLNSPYLAWQTVWQTFFGVSPWQSDSDSVAAQADQLLQRLRLLAPDRLDLAPLLNRLLQLELPENDFTARLEAKDRKGARESLLRDCLVAAGRAARQARSALLLVLEDIHWIDPLSFDLLETFAWACDGLPVMLLLTYRPLELPDSHRRRLEALPGFEQIALASLSPTDVTALAAAKLSQTYPAQASTAAVQQQDLLKRMLEQAQGNPFYVEELLNYLSYQKINPFETAPAARLELPTSLQSLVLSRIDQLTERQKASVKAASVIGRLFRFAWLHGYYPALGEPESLRADMDELARLELTLVEPDEPELTYLFRHVITQEVAYESLPYTLRARLHEQLAQFIELAQAESPNPPLDLLAFHYDRSDNLDKKRLYLRQAGEAAQAAFANAVAGDYFLRLLQLSPAPAEQIELCTHLGDIFKLTGNWDEAEQRYRQAIALAEENNLPAAIAAGYENLGAFLTNRDDYPAGFAALEKALAAYEALQDPQGLSATLWDFGAAYHQQGQYQLADDYLNRSLTLARRHNYPRLVAQALGKLGALAWSQSQYERAQSLHEQALEIHRQAQNIRGEIAARYNLGNVAAQTGRHEEGMRLHQECLEAYRNIGDKQNIALTLNSLGIFAWERGSYSQALSYYEASLALRQELGDRRGLAMCYTNIGLVHFKLGNYATAGDYHNRSLSVCRQAGLKFGVALSLNNLGLSLIPLGQYAEAETALSEALELFRAMQDPRGIGLALQNLGKIALFTEQPRRARSYYEESLALQRAANDQPGIASGLSQVGRVLIVLGETEAARQNYEQALSLHQQHSDSQGICEATFFLGALAASAGEFTLARQRFQFVIKTSFQTGAKRFLTYALAGLAGLLLAENRPESAPFALRLAAAAQLPLPLSSWDPYLRRQLTQDIELARTRLGPAFESAWLAGQTVPLEDVVAASLAIVNEI